MIKNTSHEASDAFIHELKAAIPDVYFDRVTRLGYSTDASIYQMMPVGVALPRTADDVVAATEIAGHHGVPLLPRGGGTSLAGQAVNHALILDMTRYMDRVLEVDTEGRRVRTQPGIPLANLNHHLAKYGLMFGPDPSSADRATVGGILGCNSTGAHSIVYGMADDNTEALDVVLSDSTRVTLDAFAHSEWVTRGTRPGVEGAVYRSLKNVVEHYGEQVRSRYPRTFRHVAGYNLDQLVHPERPNLAKLMVGSEGTLGVITEATLSVVPIPRHKRLALVHFSELRASLEAVPLILESSPDAIELLDKFMLNLTRDKIEYRRLLTFVEGDPAVILIVEYAGESEAEIDAKEQRLHALLGPHQHRDPLVIVRDPGQQANVWYVRKVALGILLSIRGDAKPLNFIEDAAVPVEHLAEYVLKIVEACHEVGCDLVPMYAHASAGCVHIQPMVNLKVPDGVRQLRKIAEASARLAISFGGTTSGEHGDGIVRAEFLEWLYGSDLVRAFHEVKDAFDPNRLMNPGKILDTPPLDDESLLRFGTDYTVPFEPKETVLSFEADGGFARSVEMCNGQGVCRKLGQGVMCPSFQATREEKHSTRGRANALRSAMMGLLGPHGMTSKELYDVLDLCLSCHACKSECPSAVDMAKLKAEFMHNYYREHGTPLRAWLFANIARLNRIGHVFGPLANLLLAGPGKWALTALGVHPQRDIPRFAPQRFSAWFQGTAAESNIGRTPVVFFHDTFMEHNHPEVGRAAVRVLRAAGYEPLVLKDKQCCGRPAVSKGLLDEARRLAVHNVRLLAPYARRGLPIVGCEPSCMAMLVDEYLDLVPGEETKVVAEMAMPLDVFLAREAQAGKLHLTFDGRPRQVLFHGHCQQKATFGTVSTRQLLALIPGCTAQEIDAGCCGMAGSFGYEKEHFDLSIQIAEMVLAPAVRAAPPDMLISATGTSCREQIEHTTGRRALHPIEIVAEALAEE